jgi:hypothetical protein
MSKFCSNCGQPITAEASFCPQCGTPLEIAKIKAEPPKNSSTAQIPFDFSMPIKNQQSSIANKSLLFGLIFLVLTYFTFSEGNPISGIWALGLLGIFGLITSLVVFFIFKSRSNKMKSLITGEKVIAAWQMNDELKNQYINHLYEHESAKNKGIFFLTSILIIVIFGIFILFIDEGKGAMAMVMLALIGLIGFFAFVMPKYYKSKNAQADGKVLIGEKFAYINGFFHNWDFPLSGIRKVKIIEEPFHGLYLQYYYTDRTFTNTEELNIPVPQEIDLKEVVLKLNSQK